MKSATIEKTVSSQQIDENSTRLAKSKGFGGESDSSSRNFRDHTLYKPNKKGTGGAVRFHLNVEKKALFVEAANQSGERQFDWENKLIMKWALPDIGPVLAVFRGRQDQTKLFHKFERGNSAVDLKSGANPEQAAFFLKLSRQLTETNTVVRVGIPLTMGDAMVLEKALSIAISRILAW